jgi:hypothetical protein
MQHLELKTQPRFGPVCKGFVHGLLCVTLTSGFSGEKTFSMQIRLFYSDGIISLSPSVTQGCLSTFIKMISSSSGKVIYSKCQLAEKCCRFCIKVIKLFISIANALDK